LIAVKLGWLRPVCQIVAVILLCQTGLDLGLPSLCVLDAAGTPAATAPAARAAAGQTVGDVPAQPAPSAPAQAAGHVDDCFCCSGCVLAQTVFHVAPVVRLSPQPIEPAGNFVPLLVVPFFHPPLILG
jgi:hypothetical protein